MSRTVWKNVFVFQDCLQKDRRVVRGVTASGATSDNEWQRVAQKMTTSENKCKLVTESDSIWYIEWKQHSKL